MHDYDFTLREKKKDYSYARFGCPWAGGTSSSSMVTMSLSSAELFFQHYQKWQSLVQMHRCRHMLTDLSSHNTQNIKGCEQR